MYNQHCKNIGVYNFECLLQNEPYYIDMKFTLGEEQTPMDLTEYQDIKMSIRSNLKAIIGTLSLSDGLAIVGEDNNVLGITLSQELTLLLSTGIYAYDIMFISNTGQNKYFVKGDIKIINTITR
jgi:hypothetical protein